MAHEDDLDQYSDDDVDDSPEPVRGSRRLLIIVLGVGCLALAISDIVLAIRVTDLRRQLVAARAATPPSTSAERSPAPAVERDTATPEASAQPPAAATPPSAERPAAAPPARTESRRDATPARSPERAASAERSVTDTPDPAASVVSPTTSPAAPEPTPAPAKAAEVEPPAPPRPKTELPARRRGGEQPRVAAVTPANPERGAATPSSRERATASWMVQEYGRVDAERRARAVANFYGAQSADGAYWRRVLAEIAQH